MLLVTAFKPFFPKSWIAGVNASERVLEEIRTRRNGRYGFAVLDVSDRGLSEFDRLLTGTGWTGIMAMGENGMIRSNHVVLERFANATDRPGIRNRLGLFGETEISNFAASAESAKSGNRLSMGFGFCNSVYLRAIQWSKQQTGFRPVAFAHIPAVYGESLPGYSMQVNKLYDIYAGEVIAMVDQME